MPANQTLLQRLKFAESALEKWTREVKADIGRTTHLKTSRAFNLAYWEGYRDAILKLLGNRKKVEGGKDAK